MAFKIMDDEAKFPLTAKGWIMMKMGCSAADIDALWAEFEEFVMVSAAFKGMTAGIPCLVFDGPGGVCVTVVKNKPEKESI